MLAFKLDAPKRDTLFPLGTAACGIGDAQTVAIDGLNDSLTQLLLFKDNPSRKIVSCHAVGGCGRTGEACDGKNAQHEVAF